MLVVKVGGGESIPIDAVCQDVRDLTQQGERLILVHGASHETNVLSAALGKPPRFVTSVSGMQSRTQSDPRPASGVRGGSRSDCWYYRAL